MQSLFQNRLRCALHQNLIII